MIKEMKKATRLIIRAAKSLSESEKISEEHKIKLRSIIKEYNKNKKTDQVRINAVSDIDLIFKEVLNKKTSQNLD